MQTKHRHSAHSVLLLHVHLVLVTNYRRKVFTKAILDDMRSVFERVCLEHKNKKACSLILISVREHFLAHTGVFYFANLGYEKLYCARADGRMHLPS